MSQCRFCPAEIVWGIDEKGTRVPLDPRAPVYHVIRFDQGAGAYVVERAAGENPVHYVSHFASCPGASRASKSRRPAPRDPRAAAAGE